MPELPEVELTRENLIQWTHSDEVTECKVLDQSLVLTGDIDHLEKSFAERSLGTPLRKGKFIQWPLSDGKVLIFHMAMTGKWISRKDGKIPKGSRLLLKLASGNNLLFVDMRRFGKFWWGPQTSVEQNSGWSKLGPDAWTERKRASECLCTTAAQTQRKIGSLLLDQSILSGVGNILANEALFRSRIHPLSRSNLLTTVQLLLLFENILATIETSLTRDRGTEILYQGEKGAENPFLVYGKENLPCPVCGQNILRERLSGRSVFVCKRCQSSPI